MSAHTPRCIKQLSHGVISARLNMEATAVSVTLRGIALHSFRSDNQDLAVAVNEAERGKFLVHQSQTWLNVAPRQVDVAHHELI